MKHVEFFHRHHFETFYFRKKAGAALSQFIDFFWETDFDSLWEQHPQGFSDALFPNIGYTYLVNLGTPFIMQLEEEKFEMKSDGFLPRHKHMNCHHSKGNRIFGIKFNISPVIFEKKINFSEYREYIFPLAYLIDRSLLSRIKKADHFEQRVELVSRHYEEIIQRYSGSMKQVNVVTQVLKQYSQEKRFNTSIEDLASQYAVSSRTLQRYFESTTSISSKQALQILRIRHALEALIQEPENFHYGHFGYYDHSHFYKHLRSFLGRHDPSLTAPYHSLLQR